MSDEYAELTVLYRAARASERSTTADRAAVRLALSSAIAGTVHGAAGTAAAAGVHGALKSFVGSTVAKAATTGATTTTAAALATTHAVGSPTTALATGSAVTSSAIAAAPVGSAAIATGGAAMTVGGVVTATTAGASGLLKLLVGGKFVGGLLVGATLGTAVTTTAYVVQSGHAPTPSHPLAAPAQHRSATPTSRSRPSGAHTLSAERSGGILHDPSMADEPLIADEPSMADAPILSRGGTAALQAAEQPSTQSITAPSTTTQRANATSTQRAGGRRDSTAVAPTPNNHPATPTTRSSAESLVPPSERLMQEAAALAAVQSALNRKAPEEALALLDRQDRQFSSGQLAEERAAARVLALCAAGLHERAESARTRFATDHPNSPLTRRVRKSCIE